MYPRDNIFNIYYNIGRIVPFQVKRADRGFQALPQNLYKPSGRTFRALNYKVAMKNQQFSYN